MWSIASLFLLSYVEGFHTSIRPLRLAALRYNDNPRDKEALKKIDDQINRYKKVLKDLLEQKSKTIESLTGLCLKTDPDLFFHALEEEEDDEEYEVEIKVRGKSSQVTDSTEKSENFKVVHNKGTFEQVGGYDLVKEELMQCADLLTDPQKYANYNVRVPRGLLLEGPPGNGKTLLAKCFSGEIRVGFIPVSGSQFQEKYVGVGPSRIRELFDLAKKNSPCIIFIDEIDSVGKKRTDGVQHAEQDSTLNELLVQLDGFETADGVFLIGATNRADLLDPALTRPGRIDKLVYVGMPDEPTRRRILEIHQKNKPLNVTLEDLVVMSQGFSAAQLENLLNEAMLFALRQNRTMVQKEDLERVSNRILGGYQSVQVNLTEAEIYQVAVHEMGHALTGYMKNKPFIKVCIHLWSPKTLGFTQFVAGGSPLLSREDLFCELMILLGGRVAEELVLGKCSSGASKDLEEAARLAETMVLKFGMGYELFLPHTSDKYREEVDREIALLLKDAHQQTRALLGGIAPWLKSCATTLAQTHEIRYNDLRRLD
jgi:cell division protease FtsH